MFHKEGEKIAKQKVSLIAILTLIIGYASFELRLDYVLYGTLILFIVLIILLLFPFKVNKVLTDNEPKGQYDERDIMFSRNELVPGSEKYKIYYAKYPEKEFMDNKFRMEPGLLSEKSAYFHKEAFQRAKESFAKIAPLYNYIEGNVNPSKMELSAREFTAMIKSRASTLGVLDVGITLTRPYHFYSHKGRGHEYGNEIKSSHQFAIAFTVEMNYDMVMAAPKASIVVESAKQYLNAGIMATQLAEFIRTLGYEARPHIDGNYQVVCPLVARDAGLGEIGRMGLLMTKKHTMLLSAWGQ